MHTLLSLDLLRPGSPRTSAIPILLIATLDAIMVVSGLPKTRSGKTMRRILRKIAAGEYDGLRDVSTLADPSVVEKLIEGHKELMG